MWGGVPGDGPYVVLSLTDLKNVCCFGEQFIKGDAQHL